MTTPKFFNAIFRSDAPPFADTFTRRVRAPFPLGKDEMWPPLLPCSPPSPRRSEIGGVSSQVADRARRGERGKGGRRESGRFYERATKMDGTNGLDYVVERARADAAADDGPQT